MTRFVPTRSRPTRFTLTRLELALGAGAVLLLLANAALHVLPPQGSATTARDEMVASAEARIPALLGFGSADVEGEVAKAVGNTTPEFRGEYEGVLRQAIAAVPTGSVVTRVVSVKSIAVVESSPTAGRVLAVLEQTGTLDGVEQEPKPGRVEISLRKVGDDWLVDGVRTV